MVKRIAHNLAVALLFAASVIPVIHGFSTAAKPVLTRQVAGVTGGDPEPPSPGLVGTILQLMGLA
jgi:hypothetical protein